MWGSKVEDYLYDGNLFYSRTNRYLFGAPRPPDTLKSLSLAALCFVVALSAFGQNWQRATLHLHNGDSIGGEIDFEDWKVSPSSVRFRSNGQVKAYDHIELNSFLVGEKTQRYQLVRARLKYFNTVPVKPGGNPIDHEDSVTVYSEVLYSNRDLALYSLQDAWEDERLFIMKEGEVRELVHFTVIFEREGRNFKQENNSYREQLKQLLKDCDVVINSGVEYGLRAIIPVLRKYSACKGYEQSVERIEQRGLLSAGAYSGAVGYTSTYESASVFMLGANFQLLSKRTHNNNFVWADIGFVPGPSADNPLSQSVLLGLYGGRYFGKGKVQPLIFAGLSNIARGFDSGVGVAVNKSLVVSGSFSALATIVSAIKGEPAMFYLVKVRYFPRFRR
jgi:hypothetical protein